MNELERARRAAVLVASAHVGGCPACAQSIAALAAPRYARRLREQGVILMASPRQADVLLLCGTLNERSREAAMALVEETPRPRALVAVGDCALNGCVFAGSPALSSQSLASALSVNIEIGGCPPSPGVILEAIAEAQRLLAGEEVEAAEASEASSAETPGYELDDTDGEADAGAEPAGEREERR